MEKKTAIGDSSTARKQQISNIDSNVHEKAEESIGRNQNVAGMGANRSLNFDDSLLTSGANTNMENS